MYAYTYVDNYPAITKYKEINATCSYSYQYTEYKHLGMRNKITLQSVLSPIK